MSFSHSSLFNLDLSNVLELASLSSPAKAAGWSFDPNPSPLGIWLAKRILRSGHVCRHPTFYPSWLRLASNVPLSVICNVLVPHFKPLGLTFGTSPLFKLSTSCIWIPSSSLRVVVYAPSSSSSLEQSPSWTTLHENRTSLHISTFKRRKEKIEIKETKSALVRRW